MKCEERKTNFFFSCTKKIKNLCRITLNLVESINLNETQKKNYKKNFKEAKKLTENYYCEGSR